MANGAIKTLQTLAGLVVGATKALLGLADLADLSGASKLVGSGSAAATVTEIGVGTGLSISGTTLSCTVSAYTDEQAQDAVGGGFIDTSTIDATYDDSLGQYSWDVKVNSIGDTHLRDSNGTSVIGRNANTTGDPADITASSNGDVLRRSGTTLGFGTLFTACYADNSVTLAKLATQADQTILGNNSGGAAVPSALTAAQVRTLLGLATIATSGSASDLSTGTVPSGRLSGSYTGITGVGTVTTGTWSGLIGASILRGYIDGLTMSGDGTTTTLTVNAGICRDSTDAYTMALGAFTKVLNGSGSWTAGTGNNGIDSGTGASSTWYHVFVIGKTDGTTDVLLSTSLSSPTMPSGFTLKRRIGSILSNGTAKVTKFRQDGDWFCWDVPFNDVAETNPGTSAALKTMSTPPGVKVFGLFSVLASAASGSADSPGDLYFSDPDRTDATVGVGVNNFVAYLNSAVTFQLGGNFLVWTNTSSQIRRKLQLSAANTQIWLNTLGWMDQRGRNG